MMYFKWWEEKNLSTKNSIPGKTAHQNKAAIKIFSDKQKLREFPATRPVLQEIVKESFTLKCKGTRD